MTLEEIFVIFEKILSNKATDEEKAAFFRDMNKSLASYSRMLDNAIALFRDDVAIKVIKKQLAK